MRYTFSKVPSGITISKGFNLDCTIDMPSAALRAFKAKNLKVTINKMGARNSISKVQIYIGSLKGNIKIAIGNDGAKISLGDNSQGNYSFTMWRKSEIKIGEGTSSNGTRIFCADSGVIIGNDCMFSDNVLIQSSDQHAIVDLSEKKIINTGFQEVNIGNHVWLGRSSTILPNVSIGNGSIIGTGAIVTSDIGDKVIVAGVPARVIKHNCTWSRFHDKLDGYCSNELGTTK